MKNSTIASTIGTRGTPSSESSSSLYRFGSTSTTCANISYPCVAIHSLTDITIFSYPDSHSSLAQLATQQHNQLSPGALARTTEARRTWTQSHLPPCRAGCSSSTHARSSGYRCARLWPRRAFVASCRLRG
eukprot:1398591-Prymnesium_polylepis.1